MSLKICLLAPATSIHTQRWCEALSERGHMVTLLTIHPVKGEQARKSYDVIELPYKNPFGYLLNAKKLRNHLNALKPDVFHSHYASGYGTLGTLAGYAPHMISVWGTDIFEFPYLSPIHKWIIRRNLLRANLVTSTSEIMAHKTLEIVPELKGKIEVVPFGVDTNRFYPGTKGPNHKIITIGTVKSLTPKYGIDLLIKSFARLYNQMMVENPGLADRLHLCIYGDGPERQTLQDLIRSLGLEQRAMLFGPISHEKVPETLRTFDIFVALSRSESFGVSVVEASSAGLPVLVSSVGGLPEVVVGDKTGFVVNASKSDEVIGALEKLILSPELGQKMGAAGRLYVQSNFEWSKNVDQMILLYNRILN